jgi:dolichol-phosphate mannosyltransferase
MSTPHISVVTPVYGCAASLDELYLRLRKTLEQVSENFEIIMVDDASPDKAWEKIVTLAKSDQRVKGIRLSRNFGQHHAITAGLDHSTGEWIVVMDCDLQDRPEEILKLYRKAQEGYRVVWGQRIERRDSLLKKIGSSLFHRIYDYFTEKKSDSSIANFSIIHRQVRDHWVSLREQNRNFPLFVEWLGFRSTAIRVEHAPRPIGKSAYTLRKLIGFAVDNIVSQSNKPLIISIKFGFLISFLSFLYAIFLVIRYFSHGIAVEGWTSVMVSIYFIGGLLFANMGFLGLYIGKIFNETKGRPLYIIDEEINMGEEHGQ